MSAWQPSYLQPRTGQTAATLREIYAGCSVGERQWSAPFFARYLEGNGTGRLTPFNGILRGPGPLEYPAAQASHSLAGALLNALPTDPEVDIAVSGGLDSWLLAALLHSRGQRLRAWYLTSEVAGYCERPQVEKMAASLGLTCRYLPVTAADFVSSLPAFIAATEWPIYNLHPVSKFLLATELRRQGITTLVTGDGADQVMRQDEDCDLLPLTLTCFSAARIRVVAPFLSAQVKATVHHPDPAKLPVRQLARDLGLPEVPKQATLFPPVDLPAQPCTIDFRHSCLSYTTGLLLQALEGHRQCAGSQV